MAKRAWKYTSGGIDPCAAHEGGGHRAMNLCAAFLLTAVEPVIIYIIL